MARLFGPYRWDWRGPRRPVSRLYALNPWWLLVGNEDDGLYGDDAWRAGRPKTWRLALTWWLRNPCHNLTWYVLGVAQHHRFIVGPWAPRIAREEGGWLWQYTQIAWSPGIKLPFVGYTSPPGNGWRVEFYAGWRPSGSFGFALRLRRPRKEGTD